MGTRRIDLVGRTFGYLTVTSDAGRRGHNRLWQCRCVCGGSVCVQAANLLSGNSQSCGCQKGNLGSANRARHGQARGESHGGRTPEYKAWKKARERCNAPSCARYKDYGGRGIRMCGRWDDFAVFLADMGPRPSAQHSLDRINVDGNYEPGNCRWATREQQSNNQRKTVRVIYEGEEMSLAQVAHRAGVSVNALWGRVRKTGQEVHAAVMDLKRRHSGDQSPNVGSA